MNVFLVMSLSSLMSISTSSSFIPNIVGIPNCQQLKPVTLPSPDS